MKSEPIITGLSCSLTVDGRRMRHVTGPALYAAIGAHCIGARPSLVTKVPHFAFQQFYEVCRHLQIDPTRVESTGSEVEWKGPAINDDSETALIRGEPDINIESNVLSAWQGGLIIANMNPITARRWMDLRRDKFTAIDLFHGWIRFLKGTCLECIRKADLVTLTAHEASMLGSIGRLELNETGILVTKHGRKGVHVQGMDQAIWLPPPEIAFARCDIGAGDILLGALATAASQSSPENRFQAVIDAYLTITPTLHTLLDCRDPDCFIETFLGAS